MEKIARSIFRLQCRWMPHTRFFDWLIALQGFVYAHRRLPSRRMLVNDVLHAEKTSPRLFDPLYGFTTDKEFVKDYIASQVGREYIVETFAILKNKSDIYTFSFPERCCIKPTHSSGEVIFRKAGEPINLDVVCSWLDVNHYLRSREYQYKHLSPKIIVEPIIDDPDTIRDYKIFCFCGRPSIIQIDFDRRNHHSRQYFNSRFDELPFSMVYPRSPEKAERPARLEEMLSVANKLSRRFRFCRVDFYVTDRLYVGEITHNPESAYGKFIPREAEYEWSKKFFPTPGTHAF